MDFIAARQKLFLTADKQALVGEGDARAAFLFALPGDLIRAQEHDRFGLVDGALAVAETEAEPEAESEAEPKRQPKAKPVLAPETKPARAPETKEG